MSETQKPVIELLTNLVTHWPEMADRIQPPAILLYRARDLLLADLERVLETYAMRPADLDVLVALRVSPEPRQLTPTELYRSLLLSSGGLTKILNRLEAAGWVARPANPDDGRSRWVRLTRRGNTQVTKVMQAVVAHEVEWLSPLNQQERAQLSHLLSKLVSGQEG